MPNRQVNPKDAALRFAFFSALNFTKPRRSGSWTKWENELIDLDESVENKDGILNKRGQIWKKQYFQIALRLTKKILKYLWVQIGVQKLMY